MKINERVEEVSQVTRTASILGFTLGRSILHSPKRCMKYKKWKGRMVS